jgi:putative endonuclease
MAKHSKIGVKGEQIAEAFLLNKGYSVLHKNWRSGHKEIDIIAYKDNILTIVEIKTRTNYNVSFPEESVTRRKQQHLKIAANDFLAANSDYKNMRFDIISILMDGDEAKEIVHFEEAFY